MAECIKAQLQHIQKQTIVAREWEHLPICWHVELISLGVIYLFCDCSCLLKLNNCSAGMVTASLEACLDYTLAATANAKFFIPNGQCLDL